MATEVALLVTAVLRELDGYLTVSVYRKTTQKLGKRPWNEVVEFNFFGLNTILNVAETPKPQTSCWPYRQFNISLKSEILPVLFISTQLYSIFFGISRGRIFFIQILRNNYGLLLLKISNRKVIPPKLYRML